MRVQRNKPQRPTHDLDTLRDSRNPKITNATFRVFVQGELEYDGHIRGANGMRWRQS